jgi:hypothetical protein
MPMRGELKPAPVRSGARAPAVKSRRNWFVTALSNPDLHTVFFFCAIGLLLTLNVVLRFPNFGETVSQLAIFP